MQLGKYISFIDSDDYIEKDYVEFLYNMVKKDGTKMSICAHTVIYDNGNVINKETNERAVLYPKEVLERILYHDGIDLSAWAKLYSIDLFKNIKYPKGRLYEDAATTYLLIDLCEKISIGSVSKYNYIIRKNSITNNKFNEKKMDLIKSTEEMSNYIIKKYPELEKAAKRRLMYSYLSTLSQLVKDKDKHEKEQKEILEYIKKNKKEILKDNRTPKRDKIALYSLNGGIKLYKVLWNLYTIITRR